MKSYLIRPPKVFRRLFSHAHFRFKEQEKIVYLTFDDGPHLEATPFVLSVLKKHQVKATFFLLGKNVEKHPNLVEKLRMEGHTIANHGMNHKDGWKTPFMTYIKDIKQGKKVVKSNIFRPPYGRLGFFQYLILKRTEKIVFWDVLSGDFDDSITGEQVVSNVLSNVRNGSIIVMHESNKSFKNVRTSLNEILTQLLDKGYRFDVIQQ